MQLRARLRAQAVLAASRRLNTLIATARDGPEIAVNLLIAFSRSDLQAARDGSRTVSDC